MPLKPGCHQLAAIGQASRFLSLPFNQVVGQAGRETSSPYREVSGTQVSTHPCRGLGSGSRKEARPAVTQVRSREFSTTVQNLSLIPVSTKTGHLQVSLLRRYVLMPRCQAPMRLHFKSPCPGVPCTSWAMRSCPLGTISKLRHGVKWFLKATRQWVQEAEALWTKLGSGSCGKWPSPSRFQG